MPLSNGFQWISTWQNLTSEKGAYVIGIDLKTTAPAPPKFDADFSPGLYFYAGSANGPGGIQARCRRHLRKNKQLHWHIDWLTSQAAELWILAFPGASECALMDILIGEPDTYAVFPKFGSSDCNRCSTHLILCPDGHDQEQQMLRFSKVFRSQLPR